MKVEPGRTFVGLGVTYAVKNLRDEVAGTHGTIWMNHFLRTGFEMFTAGGGSGYVAEKAETSAGWLFPVGSVTIPR